jgi:hypothetical protein
MSERKFPCPVPGCRETTVFFGLDREETLMPYSEEAVIVIPRIPLGLMRNFRVACPVHGEKNVQEEGHHRTDRDGRAKRRRRNRKAG